MSYCRINVSNSKGIFITLEYLFFHEDDRIYLCSMEEKLFSTEIFESMKNVICNIRMIWKEGHNVI